MHKIFLKYPYNFQSSTYFYDLMYDHLFFFSMVNPQRQDPFLSFLSVCVIINVKINSYPLPLSSFDASFPFNVWYKWLSFKLRQKNLIPLLMSIHSIVFHLVEDTLFRTIIWHQLRYPLNWFRRYQFITLVRLLWIPCHDNVILLHLFPYLEIWFSNVQKHHWMPIMYQHL